MTDYSLLLRENDLKATFQRMQILETISKFGHLTIDSIYTEISKVHSSISLATIYKNILMMVDKGVLTEVPIIGKKSKYEIKKDEHIHLICISCGDVHDKSFKDRTIEYIDSISDDFLLSTTHREINLYGVCNRCNNI